MTAAWTVTAVASLAIALVGCTQELPSPGVTPAYDPFLAFCERNLTSMNDVCSQLEKADIPTVYAHILLGHAGGHRLDIHGEVITGGDLAWDEEPVDIPVNRSYRYSIQIDRDQACSRRPCTLKITAYIDGELTLAGSFTFA